jgi:hypothetical protein
MTLVAKYSKPLTIGTKVAFNGSGSVYVGKILKISPRKQYGKTHCEWTKDPFVTVEVESDGGISKVQNVAGIISLD